MNLPPVGVPSSLVVSSCSGVNSCAGLAVDDHRVPLGERAAAGVLAGQPDQSCLRRQGIPAPAVRRTPSRPCPRRPSRGASPAPACTRGCTVKPSGTARCASPMRASSALSTAVFMPRGNHLVGLHRLAGLDLVLLEVADLVEDPLELALVVAQGVLGLFHRDVAAADQRFGVGLADAALGVDDVVHRGLRHRRVVALVVPAAAVAQHVDDDVLLELLPEVHRQPGHPHRGLGIVAVDVEDRRTDHLRDVGAVLRRTSSPAARW